MAYRLPLVIKGVGFDVIPSAAALGPSKLNPGLVSGYFT